ncbi:hypothetical protein [Streptococcus thoraltensis]|uniref:hypothetical protein n=1 Tax=Streptococcus thoraltensis TaxID=55085 RepID=UPI00036FE16A|nr:hypothetical protein [Streptococcus thoraltensis]QBX31136.1 hypothetical protein Javan616_0043 [Streptococcus phage Javan616]
MDNTKDSYKKYNKRNPMVRMERDVYDRLVDFCNENDLVISSTISRFINYSLNNVEIKEVSVPTEELFIGNEKL